MKVAVIGATGMLGKPVAKRLLADGIAVRVLSRDPDRAAKQLGQDFEYVQADVRESASLERAFDKCDAVHMNLSAESRDQFEATLWHGVVNVGSVARTQGMKLVSIVSGDWQPDPNHSMPNRAAISKGILALERMELPTIVWGATWFFESLEYFILEDRALMVGLQPLDWHFIAADDYADWVSKAMKRAWTGNHRFTVHGPEPMKMFDALRAYCAVMHPQLPVEHKSIAEVKQFARASEQHAWLEGFANFMANFETLGEEGDGKATPREFGEPRWTLRAWLDHQAPKR